jgi:hypothetical protein
MNQKKSSKVQVVWPAVVLLAAACLALPPVAAAQNVAEMRAASAGVDFHPLVEYGALVLTVSGPDGYAFRAEFGAGESPFFSIFDKAGGVLPDGTYNYELRVAPTNTQRREAFEANQAATKSRGGVEALAQSGAFSIADGAVVSGGTEPGAGANVGGNRLSTKDQVIPDDLIVQSSLCVGFDCVNGESFGFDTIRLKENNTRIKFEDTSVGTFPTTDWQLTANDSASGGQNKFSIEDVTSVRVPFTIEGGSTTNSIYVDSTGRVGFRTSTPVLDLHVATSNSPALRLEQTSAGGFTAQTWDIAGNEANFFVRDVTGGSRLPFRIRPGAPTSSLDISASGDVGIGTASPDVTLDVEGSDGNTQLRVTETNGTAASRTMAQLVNNGEARLNFLSTNTSSNWELISGTTFVVNRGGSGVNEMIINSGGNVTIAGLLTQNSDRTTKTDINPVDPEAVLAKVAELPIATWRKIGDTGTHLGPMAQDFAAAFGLGEDDRRIAAVDMAGVSLAAIQALHQELAARDAEIASLRAQLAEEVTALKAAVEELQPKQ